MVRTGLINIALLMSINAPAYNINAVRKLYYDAAKNSNNKESFYEAVTTMPENDALISGYKGIATVLMAECVYNPYSKLSYFTKGKRQLEAAIAKDPSSVELVFLRYCIQTNAPFFLQYNGNIETDKKMLLSRWSSLTDADLKKRIADYMKDSKFCNSAEKKVFS